MLNLEQHQNAILDIVNNVDRLITDKTARKRFTDHIDHFCKIVEDYGQALIPHIEKVEKAIEKLKEKGATRIPPPNEVFPPPKDWVDIRKVSWPSKPTESEALMCDYVSLAMLHNYELEEQETYAQIFSDKYDGKWFQRDKFRKGIPVTGDIRAFESFISMDRKLSDCLDRYTYRPRKPVFPLWWFKIEGDRLSRLKRAFDHVQTDLKPEKKGMAKRIIGWILKKTWHFVVTIIGAIVVGIIVTVVIDILGDFGWIEQIKAFIYNVLPQATK